MGTDMVEIGETINPARASELLTNINAFSGVLRANLVEEQDYAVIVEGQAPTLLKPGAEKIVSLMGLWPEYEIVTSVETWDAPVGRWPVFYYQIRCRLRRAADGKQVGEGLGSCNNSEKKYRFKRRGTVEKDPNEAFDLVNTVLKIAEKRALVHATLTIARVSGLFTQDLEDMPSTTAAEREQKQAEKPKEEPKEEKKNKHGLTKSDLAALSKTLKAYPELREEFGLKGKKQGEITREQWTGVMGRALELDVAQEETTDPELDKETETLGLPGA